MPINSSADIDFISGQRLLASDCFLFLFLFFFFCFVFVLFFCLFFLGFFFFFFCLFVFLLFFFCCFFFFFFGLNKFLLLRDKLSKNCWIRTKKCRRVDTALHCWLRYIYPKTCRKWGNTVIFCFLATICVYFYIYHFYSSYLFLWWIPLAACMESLVCLWHRCLVEHLGIVLELYFLYFCSSFINRLLFKK